LTANKSLSQSIHFLLMKIHRMASFG